MQASLETLSSLERRLKVAVPMDQIDTEVGNRLKRLQRTAKLQGFRPGKVPLRVVEQQYGPKVRQEVLGDTVERTFTEAVREKNLRVAGSPRIEATPAADAAGEFAFTATFEIFPDIVIGDVSDVTIERAQVDVADAEVDKTLEVLRKQRTEYVDVTRPAMAGDAANIDYRGTIDGVAFEGGEAKGQAVVLGEAKLLRDFEAGIVGLSVGETKSFEVTFPADYHGVEVAGKLAMFEVTMNRVQEARLPPLDAAFAQSLGIVDGDLGKMREDVRSNLGREVKRRVQARTKDLVLKALLEVSRLDVPKALIDMEAERLMAGMAESLKQRGLSGQAASMPREAFDEEARRRVTIGLILAELVKTQGIKAQPEQVKAMIEDYAQSYERPEEVIRWYYQSAERVREVESVVIENNVVEWVLGNAKVVDAPMPFDDLMGASK